MIISLLAALIVAVAVNAAADVLSSSSSSGGGVCGANGLQSYPSHLTQPSLPSDTSNGTAFHNTTGAA